MNNADYYYDDYYDDYDDDDDDDDDDGEDDDGEDDNGEDDGDGDGADDKIDVGGKDKMTRMMLMRKKGTTNEISVVWRRERWGGVGRVLVFACFCTYSWGCCHHQRRRSPFCPGAERSYSMRW